MVWFSVVGVLFVFAVYILLSSRKRRLVVVEPAARGCNAASTSMTVDQARNVVDELIRRERLDVQYPATADFVDGNLGPITCGFFSKYSSLRTKRGGFELAIDLIGESSYGGDFISIGHSEDWDVVVCRGLDEVYVVEGSENEFSDFQLKFPSVYHLVVDEVSLA